MQLSLVIVVIFSVLSATISVEITNESVNIPRIKRSGSFDFVGHVKSGIVSGITRASASVAAGSSGSSSSSSSSSNSNEQKGYHYPAPSHHDESRLDGVQLKKAIFNTLFQAVKAITGGVTAIKGRLIKGSGYLVSASGKLIQASGDSVTGVGKKIVSSAHLVPPEPSHFAKLSALSSIPHASSGSSSSSSSHDTHISGHGGASFTSFEEPSSHHVDSYESHAPTSTGYAAPIHSAPSAHGGYLPPSSHGTTAYNAPAQTYGAPSHGSSHSSSYSEVNAIKNSYETHEHGNNDFTAHSASISTGHNQHSESLRSAAEALRQILHKLPTPTSIHNQNTITHDTHTNNDHFQLTQFDIPPDPESPPPFKPLGPQQNSYHSNNGYLPPQEPLHAISQTHIITTAYGAPITDYQKPVPLIDVHTSWKRSKESTPNHLHQNPNDIYRKMTLKRSPNHYHNNNNKNIYSRQHQQPEKHIPQPNTLFATHNHQQQHDNNMDNLVHQQQLNKIKHTIGTDFEIQKSVGFELNEHEPAQIKRRISSALAQS